MANTISVKVDTKRIALLLNGLGPKAEEVLDVAARHIEVEWKRHIVEKDVVDTGAYLNSVHVTAEHGAFARVVADGVEYGIYQEDGTSSRGARPCGTPALEAERRPFLEAWKELLR
jgi:hypothetical protein